MRFLLKPTARSAAAKSSQNMIASATKAVASSQQHAPTSSATPTSSSKGWGQQCSPNCGCVLRIETQLSETPSSISPTIVQASYHAKRVMATNTTTNDANAIHQLKPLLVTTQHSNNSNNSNSSTGSPSRPILTSCTCPTLHTLAKRTIEHLPGKTLAQIRNEIGNNMGSSSAGLRSSVALRHTVLREQMIQIDLPTTVSVSSRMGTKKNKNKLGISIASSVDSIQHQQLGKRHTTDTQIKNGDIHSASASSGAQEMNLTDRHGHCYDLFEDSLLSMIYERMPSPRKEDHSATTYSPTLGGPFRMYSIYERNKPPRPGMNDEPQQEQEQQQQELEHYHDLLSSYEARSWQTKSPSSFFLFGDDYSSSPTNGTSSSSSTLNMTSMLFQNMMESIHTGIFGEETRRNNAATATTAASDRDDDYAASTSYLELLDMYGDDHNGDGDEDHQQALDDWLEYVDQMHYSDGVNRSRSTG